MKYPSGSAVESQISALLNQAATAQSLNQVGAVELRTAHYEAYGAWCQELYERYLKHVRASMCGSVVTAASGAKIPADESFMREVEAHVMAPVSFADAPRFRAEVLAYAAEFIAPPYRCHIELGRAIERYVQVFTLRALVAGVLTHRL
jgi:predicted Ser/Thr protein kinase